MKSAIVLAAGKGTRMKFSFEQSDASRLKQTDDWTYC